MSEVEDEYKWQIERSKQILSILKSRIQKEREAYDREQKHLQDICHHEGVPYNISYNIVNRLFDIICPECDYCITSVSINSTKDQIEESVRSLLKDRKS